MMQRLEETLQRKLDVAICAAGPSDEHDAFDNGVKRCNLKNVIDWVARRSQL